MTTPAEPAPPLAWSWSAAALGGVCSIPAVIVASFDVTSGLALAFGVLPASIVGVLPLRAMRVRSVVLGALIASAILLGSLVAGAPIVAVLVIFGSAVGAATLAARRPFGQVLLTLALPMIGIGLSFTDAKEAAGLAVLIVAGSVFAYLVALLWPERAMPSTQSAAVPLPSAMLDYGIRLGLAGATAAAIGFALDLDHVGWAVAAALLVMRPTADMQRRRSIGRVISVAVGAFVAGAMASAAPAPGWYSLAAFLVLVGAAATRLSRWYVTPAFTTFIAISLLVYAHPSDVRFRLGERIGETLLGVGLAYAFGLVLPKLLARRS